MLRSLIQIREAFDGYVAQPIRVSATSLIHFRRNRYSVPTAHAHGIAALHSYPDQLVVVADDKEIARLCRCCDHAPTFYDWQHYLALIGQKPGALRYGTPFLIMPPALELLQRHLLKHSGDDWFMAQVLS